MWCHITVTVVSICTDIVVSPHPVTVMLLCTVTVVLQYTVSVVLLHTFTMVSLHTVTMM